MEHHIEDSGEVSDKVENAPSKPPASVNTLKSAFFSTSACSPKLLQKKLVVDASTGTTRIPGGAEYLWQGRRAHSTILNAWAGPLAFAAVRLQVTVYLVHASRTVDPADLAPTMSRYLLPSAQVQPGYASLMGWPKARSSDL